MNNYTEPMRLSRTRPRGTKLDATRTMQARKRSIAMRRARTHQVKLRLGRTS